MGRKAVNCNAWERSRCEEERTGVGAAVGNMEPGANIETGTARVGVMCSSHIKGAKKQVFGLAFLLCKKGREL